MRRGRRGVALLIPWLPHAASKQAGRIDFVFWFVTVICIGDLRARRRGDPLLGLQVPRAAGRGRGRRADPRQHRPRDRLDGGSRPCSSPRSRSSARSCSPRTSTSRTPRPPRRPADPLVVNVTAQQFAWSFQYPDFGNAHLGDAEAADRRDDQAADHLAGRDPLVLGAAVRPEGGRGPGHGDHPRDHARPEGHVPGDLHGALRARPRGHALDRAGDDLEKFLSWAKGQQKQLGGPSGGASGQGRLQRERLRELPHLRARRRQGNGRARPR